MGLFGKKKDKGKEKEPEAASEDVTVRISNSKVPPLNLRGLFPEKIRGKVFEVNEQGGTVGSLPENTIPLQDTQKSVSRTHCRILFSQSDMCYHIADLNSSNGTSLTTDKSTFKLSPQTYFQLKSGFIIHIGVEVQLIVAEDKSAGPAVSNANANYMLHMAGSEAEGARAPPVGGAGAPGGGGAIGPGGRPMGPGGPGMSPGMGPGMGGPGMGGPPMGGSMAPGYGSMAQPGMAGGVNPGMGGGMPPGNMYSMQPGMNPGMAPGMAPGMNPGMGPGMMPAYGSAYVSEGEPQFHQSVVTEFGPPAAYNPPGMPTPVSYYESPAPAPYGGYGAPAPYGGANPYASVSTAAVDDELEATLAALAIPGMAPMGGGMPPMGGGMGGGMPPMMSATTTAGADNLQSMAAGGGGQGKLKAYFNKPDGSKPVQRVNLLQYSNTTQVISAVLASFGLKTGRVRYKDQDNDEIDIDPSTDLQDLISYANTIQVYPQ